MGREGESSARTMSCVSMESPASGLDTRGGLALNIYIIHGRKRFYGGAKWPHPITCQDV